MYTRYFALIFGIIYALVGLMGFIPGLVQPPAPTDPPLAVDANYGYLLGLFPVNVLHNLFHLVVGVLGVVAFQRFDWARTYCRVFAIVFFLLALMGFFPGLNTTFGLIPLFSHDIWLHVLTTIATAYFGFLAAQEAEYTDVSTQRSAQNR
jgi:hypothetical protein